MLALLSGASPKSCKHGPVVRLHKGSWRLNVQGQVDSTLLVHVEGYEAGNLLTQGMMIHCDETELVQLHFGTRGTEPYITVTAEKVA